MEEANAVASNVARATLAALDWRSSPDDRKAAAAYIESIKTGDVRVLATASFLLVKKDWSSEIRLQAFKLLQHLVRLRWEELSPEERRNFAKAAMDLMAESADSSDEWALKSQTAVLVAEMVRREGLSLWQELVHPLATLANKGPIQAELVLMMLRWLPEDITVHNEDLEGDRRRLLLRGLTQSLSEILPLLYSLLERHFGAALSEAGRQQFETAKQHAAAVTAALHAITAYAEWAPLLDLAKYGVIHGCGILLSSPDFRLQACEFFKLVCPRRRPPEASASEFDAAMGNVFQILMNVTGEFLSRSASNPVIIEEREYEFAEYICESMVSLGSSNLQCISGDSSVLTLYLQQMLGYFQHYKLGLHFQSLHFWLALMRDLTSKPKVHAHSAGESSSATASNMSQVDPEKKRLLTFIHDEICSAILDASFPRLVKKEKVLEKGVSLGTLELWSNDFEDKGDFGQYRAKLLELIRFIALYKPLLAASKIAERIIFVIKNSQISPNAAQDLAVIESMPSALENVVIAAFEGLDAHGGASSETQQGLCITFEALLQQLLGLKWTEPALVVVLGHYMDALGPFLKYYPNAVGSVINKLFELLTSLPSTLKDPSMNSARHARLNICTSFIRIAKAADKSVVPHMKAIADTMAQLQREGRLLRGEHNILGEAFLIIASAAGSQQQQEVLVWFLEPLSQQWLQPDWQNNYLSDPSGLVRLCMEPSFMWSIFHTVTFFEKALKRSGYRKSNLNAPSISSNSDASHPMASHLSWMLPPLLKLLRVLHSLWSPSVLQNLPKEIIAAMSMSDVERTSLLGEGQSKSSKTALTFVDDQEERLEPNENDIRNWMKGIRDSGYNVLGLSTTLGEPFYKTLDSQSIAVALVENIQSMDFRHLRQLVHSILIPLVKYCPTNMWELWLEKLLHPLFSYSQQALCSSWSALIHEGRAKIPDTVGMTLGSELKVEVMEEKLLRGLTREVCSLLSVIASPGLNTGLPSLDQSGHANRVDLSALKDLDSFSQSSMVSFLMKRKELVLPVLKLSLEVLTWTDSDAVGKVTSFCSTLAVLAISTNNMELCEFVSRDLFSSIIHALTLESNAFNSGDLVALSREIFVYLCDRHPAPRQVLLCLPSLTLQDLAAFEEAMSKTLSPKEQKQHMKSLLVLATGNKLKALAAQKGPVSVITNMSSRPRSSAMNAPETRVEEEESLGLASIL